MSQNLLHVESLSKFFHTPGQTLHVLKNVTLALGKGQTMAITGPSGSGKSTLLGIMAGLERPTQGNVLYENQNIHSWDEEKLSAWRRQNLGFIFQNFRLVPSLTALENVALPLEINRVPAPQAIAHAQALLDELGLKERQNHFPVQLSGGEQQRVAIARAYAHKPRVILADEPTGSLDRETAARVLDQLLEANARHGAALIIVTHDPAVAGRLSKTVSLEKIAP